MRLERFVPRPVMVVGRRLALAALVLSACEAPADTLDLIETRGFVRAGYAQEAPYAFVDESGRVGGESVEAFRAAMEDIEVDSVRWILLDFDDLIPALRDGRVDAVASGMFVTEERRRLVSFTRRTLCARAALLHRPSVTAPSGLTSFSAVGGPRLAVIEGAVEKTAAEILGVPAKQLVVVPDLSTGISAVRTGAADALALSAPTIRRAVAGDAELTWGVYEPPDEVAPLVAGCGAIAFRPEDQRLRDMVDAALSAYVGSDAQASVLRRLGLTPVDVRIPVEADPGRSR